MTTEVGQSAEVAASRFRFVRERDIDLILCAAAAAVPAVAELFRPGAGLPTTRHSLSDRRGEVDVALEWADAVVHVENKVDADFQKDQPERYRARAEAAQLPTSTVLLAPERYLRAKAEQADKFDARVSYELLRDALATDGSPLSRELVLLLQRGIDQQRDGRPANYSDETTEFWQAFGQASEDRGLPWRAPTTPQSDGRGFFTLKSWRTVGGLSVSLSAKVNQHSTVDISVSGAAHVLEAARVCWADECVVVRTPKKTSETLIVGRWTPSIHTDSDERSRAIAIDRILDVANHHIKWWVATGEAELSQMLVAASEGGAPNDV